MIEPVDFHNGLIIEYEGAPYQILWFQNHKTAMSHAIMRVKFKNLYTGSILERTFKQADRFKEVTPTKRKNQFLYADGDAYHFMDLENFEQTSYPKEKLGEMAQFLSENLEVEALYLDDKFLSISLPTSVELKVTSTVPGVKGDSVSNMMKPATLETGIEVNVPLFVKEGDTIKVDTRSGEYLSSHLIMLKKRLEELLEFVESTDLQEVVWEKKGSLISFRRSVLPDKAHKAAASESIANLSVEAVKPSEPLTIKSTMVGTFFRSDSPERPPLVVEGTVVAGGQSVAAIEAMKIMKDVLSPTPCKIIRALVANGHPVEYGQPLFEIATVPEEPANV